MLVYPQLATGALTHFPVRKRLHFRTVARPTLDGRIIKLPDPAGGVTEWELTYTDLSDEEAAALQQFFLDAEGTLGNFSFVDPLANLLASSGGLLDGAWTKGPLLSLCDGLEDPFGQRRAWRVVNPGGGTQAITQEVASPSEYLYCLSTYVRAAGNQTLALRVGGNHSERQLTSEWVRQSFTSVADGSADPVVFGLEFPPNSIVEVFGTQVEAQPGASLYKDTVGGGLYQNARLRDDVLELTTTGPNRHSCTVTIFHANSL
jgi:hypothetical protein